MTTLPSTTTSRDTFSLPPKSEHQFGVWKIPQKWRLRDWTIWSFVEHECEEQPATWPECGRGLPRMNAKTLHR